MNELFEILKDKQISLPAEVKEILLNCQSYKIFDSVAQLESAAVDGKNQKEVKYQVPGKGEVTEAVVHKVTNGISVNYTEPYMRRRDPDTMVIADNLPTDKELFSERFGYDFEPLRKETFQWLKEQNLAVFFYFAGRDSIGAGGIALCPDNAGFFEWGYPCSKKLFLSKSSRISL
jgi:hypothetical protein